MRTFGTFWVAGVFVCMVGCGGSSSSNNGNGGSGGKGGGSGTPASGRSPSTGGQCPSSSGQTCTGEDAYVSCLLAACGTQYKACFGNNYASGNFSGGACADWMTCEMACPCDATASTCENSCTMQLATAAGQTCASALLTLETCISGASCTQPVCSGGGTATATATYTSIDTSTYTNIDTSTYTSINTSTLTGTGAATGTGTGAATGTNCAALQTCCSKMTGTLQTACQTAVTGSAGVDSTCASILPSLQAYCP